MKATVATLGTHPGLNALLRPHFRVLSGAFETFGDCKKEEIEAVVIRSPHVLGLPEISRLPALQVVVRAGAGTDNLDLDALADQHVKVFTVALNYLSVAELSIGLMFALAREIPRMHSGLIRGEWLKQEALGVELANKTMTVVGFGRVGRRVAQLALGVGMKVLVVDRSPTQQQKQEAFARWVEIEETTFDCALPRTDVLVLCCSYSPETHHLVNRYRLSQLKSDALLINVSRGQVIDQEALHTALSSGKLRGAALDVHSKEPPDNLDLLSLPNVIGTPHIGAQTLEAHERIAHEVLRILQFEL